MAQYKGYRNLAEISGKPQLCHVHVMARSGILAYYLKLRYGIPFVISEHWTGYVNGAYNGLKKIATPFLLKQSAGISTVSRYLADHMINAGLKKNYKLIPNAIDTTAFLPTVNNSSKHTILHISDLKDDHKNISGLMKAVKMVRTGRDDFRLQIVGDGPDRERLVALRSKLGLDDCVIFSGEIKGKALIETINECRFLSLFSNYETFGVVLIEALSCGKPVVASKLPAIEEFIGEQQGILVSPGNEKELAEAFNKMLDTYSEYEPGELHRYIENHYSFNAVGLQFSNWYESILSHV